VKTGEDSLLRTLGTVRGAITAIATVVTAVLGVVFLLIPSWRPLPRDEIGASLSIITLENGVPLLDWAARQYPHDTAARLRDLLGHDPTPTDRSVAGLVAYVRLETQGFKRRSIRLRPRLYDAKTRRPAKNVSIDQIYPKISLLKIDAPSRSSIQLLLLDDITDIPGRYFLRVEAIDDAGVLAFADSKPFTPPTK
jgi:hypothetical protein